MNKILLSILILLFTAGVCVITCPKHEDHSKTIIAEFNKVIDKEFSENTDNDVEKAFAMFASSICSGISEYVIEKKLLVDNYFVFSVGKFNIDGKSKIVSIGVFNHVFTDLEDTIKEELKKLSDSTNSKSDKQRKKTKKLRKKNKSESFSQIEETNETSDDDYADNYYDTTEIENITDESNETNSVYEYNNDINYEPVFTAVEQMPQFPGGDAALMKFISNNINYPQEAYKNGTQGRVIVQFVVKSNGSIGEVKVIRSVDQDLDNEAIRICKSLPKFIPGRMNGKAVNVWYTLPITFKLQGTP